MVTTRRKSSEQTTIREDRLLINDPSLFLEQNSVCSCFVKLQQQKHTTSLPKGQRFHTPPHPSLPLPPTFWDVNTQANHVRALRGMHLISHASGVSWWGGRNKRCQAGPLPPPPPSPHPPPSFHRLLHLLGGFARDRPLRGFPDKDSPAEQQTSSSSPPASRASFPALWRWIIKKKARRWRWIATQRRVCGSGPLAERISHLILAALPWRPPFALSSTFALANRALAKFHC